MRRRQGRTGVARLAILATLFQAILFGWHHHDLVWGVSGVAPAVAAPNGAMPLVPAQAGDDCDICATLHHLTGAPAQFAPPPPALPSVALAPSQPAPVVVAGIAGFSFRARAPPRI